MKIDYLPKEKVVAFLLARPRCFVYPGRSGNAYSDKLGQRVWPWVEYYDTGLDQHELTWRRTTFWRMRSAGQVHETDAIHYKL